MLCRRARGSPIEFCSYEVLVGRTFVINVLSERGNTRAVLACIRKNSHLSGDVGVLARIIPHLFISSINYFLYSVVSIKKCLYLCRK